MNEIIFGDCRESMKKMAVDGVQVQTCVTSPPYFGLRDYGNECQLGLERTPEEYVQNLVSVFRHVREILADDGTVWLNLGDSYNAAGRKGHGSRQGYKQETNRASAERADTCRPNVPMLKEKDLIGVPWRVAFALQADGWYLRQDIIWAKPNPMPESVRDRCTKSHEYIFLLSKNVKYYFDSGAIKETAVTKDVRRPYGSPGANLLDSRGYQGNGKIRAGVNIDSLVRNKRDVWTVTTKPYRGAHFATFPADLIEPCILAGSRRGDTVLDPFMGSGTTAQVAVQHGRNYMGCELNPAYAELQQKRIASVSPDVKISA